MPPESADLDARIVELHSALASTADDERRSTLRAELAARLGARYMQFHGSDDDRAGAERLAQEVLADTAATAEQKQMMSLLLPTLTMMTITPAAVLRDHGPTLDAGALRLTGQWQHGGGPAAMLAGLGQLLGQLDAVDTAGLPPEIRWSMNTVRAAMGLLADVQRDDWDGRVEPEVSAQLRVAVSDAPAQAPGLDLMRGLVALVDPGNDRVTELETALTGLPGDGLLAPVLQADLARALLAGDGSGGPQALVRVTELLETAVAGLPEDNALRDDAVRMLAGALVARAGADPSPERLAAARALATDLVERPAAPDDEARLGSDLFLTSLIGLLHAMAGEERDAAAAVGDLVRAVELLPVGHPLRPVAVGQLGAVLADRHLMDGLLENADAATYLLDSAVAAAGADAPFITCVAAVARLTRAVRLDLPADVAIGAARLRDGLAALPAGHWMRPNLRLVLGVAELKTAVLAGSGVGPAVIRLRSTASEAHTTIVGVPPSVIGTLIDGLDVLAGLVCTDPEAIVAGIARMEAQLDATEALPHQRIAQRALLGRAYLAAVDAGVELTGAAARAVTHLEEARRQLGEGGADTMRLTVLGDLGVALRVHGDEPRSRRVGFEQLATHAAITLLQSGVPDALTTARGAAADAARLMRWCLADGDLEGAAQAVELGRGLTLHAATSTAGVPAMLEEVGETGLAREWRSDVAARRDDPPPWTGGGMTGEPDYERAADDLRQRVLTVLRTRPEGQRLFMAPSGRDIGGALDRLGRDAVAYLVPGEQAVPGHVLLVDAAGVVSAVEAPQLRLEPHGPVAAYVGTPRFGVFGQTTIWRTALERVCSWAGDAAMGPLRDALGRRRGGRPDDAPRVVLVPGGLLGVVPWQAARLPAAAPEVRFACQELVLSTAASARQLLDVASRIARPLKDAPVLVSDPQGTLPGFRDEVLALRGAFYPGARVLGDLGASAVVPEGRGTPQELLDLLAEGLSLLHLSCHATAADTLDASHLGLTQPLSIRTVLEHAARRDASASGPTVVFSACDSDVTRQDHDEALTPATAFLAAGAVTVVGARWEVQDRFTGVAMFALHHFVVAESLPPADALRSAQLWMLDPRREPLPGMPEDMARRARRRQLADLSVWAAFGHHGR